MGVVAGGRGAKILQTILISGDFLRHFLPDFDGRSFVNTEFTLSIFVKVTRFVIVDAAAKKAKYRIETKGRRPVFTGPRIRALIMVY